MGFLAKFFQKKPKMEDYIDGTKKCNRCNLAVYRNTSFIRERLFTYTETGIVLGPPSKEPEDGKIYEGTRYTGETVIVFIKQFYVLFVCPFKKIQCVTGLLSVKPQPDGLVELYN